MQVDSLPSPLRNLASRVWLWRVASARSRTIRPMDAPQAYAAGRDSIRMLVVGSGPVAGWGVGSHDLALPGALARAVAATTGRGAVVDVIPGADTGVRSVGALLDDADLSRYAAVVVSVTMTDALHRVAPERWEARMRTLVGRIRSRTDATIVWLGCQPIRSIRPYDNEYGDIVQRTATELNRRAAEVCASSAATVFIPLGAPPHNASAGHRTPADYLFWARQIADVVAPDLADSVTAIPPAPATDRVDAIKRLRLHERSPDARLDGLIGTARRTLQSDIALFSVLDDEKQWHLASSGTALAEFPLEESVCIYTIATDDGMVVPNAEDDPRFSENAMVTGPAHLRFYAGYPVEAPDGTRIGAICVFGRTARDPTESETDLDVLRELALLAQRELWRWEPGEQ